MSEQIYKFNTHLLKLSKSKDLEIAKTEWREIYREKREEKTGLCICQHTLKNIIYMYNINTKHTISVGTSCCKKFKLQIIKINNILEKVISEMLINGEYKIINNILEYTNNIKTQLIKHIRNEYENMTNLENLKNLSSDIKILINDYDLTYLQDIYDKTMEKIINGEKKKYEKKMELETLKLKQIQQKKEYEKKMELEKLKTQQKKEYKKNLELENLKICCRCHKNLENDNIIKYNEEITKKGVLFACKTCSLLINNWLERGYKEKSFTY